MPVKKTDEQVDGEEEVVVDAEDAEAVEGDGDETPDLARFQVWQGRGGNRVITAITPAPNADTPATVSYQTEATVDSPPEEKTSTLEEFQKWGKKMIGTIG
jgi:hypothetical protein